VCIVEDSRRSWETAINKMYQWKRPDGSIAKGELAKLVDAAGSRIRVGDGPYDLLKDGEVILTEKTRQRIMEAVRNHAEGAPVKVKFAVRRTAKAKETEEVRRVFAWSAYEAVPKLDPKRKAMVEQARWMIAHEPSIHYSVHRPIPQYSKDHLPMTLDCSGSVISLARWAGVKSPSGTGYASGSTEQLYERCPKIDLKDAQPGDLVLYSIGSDQKHVSMILVTGGDPLLFSHGLEAGPQAIRLSLQKTYHAGETVTFHRMPV
jgi:NlpC/P60 family